MAVYLNGQLVIDPHKLGGVSHDADTLAGLNAKISDATLDDSGDPRTPAAHATDHEPGGGDAMAVDVVAGTGSLRTLGTGAQQACVGDDSRLSDARTPIDHAASHQNGGGDDIDVAGLSGQLADGQPALAHALGGSAHSADTLADLNSKVSDATLVDASHVHAQRSLFPAINGGTVGLSGNQIAYMTWHDSYAGESTAQTRMPACTVKKISFYVSTNSLNSDSLLTLRKNGGDTSDTISIGAGVTGLFEADWNTAFADGDLLSARLDVGGTGGQGIYFKGGLYELLIVSE